MRRPFGCIKDAPESVRLEMKMMAKFFIIIVLEKREDWSLGLAGDLEQATYVKSRRS